MAKKAAPKAQEFIEKQLWKAADKLRGSCCSPLSLISSSVVLIELSANN